MPAPPHFPDAPPSDGYLTRRRQMLNGDFQTVEPAPNRPDWPALILINQFRFFVLMVLAGVYYAPDQQGALGSRNADLFEIAHLLWVVLALGFTYLIRIKRPDTETQLSLQSYLDMVCITMMLYASGGVASGLGPLLLIGVALLSQMVQARLAMLFAAIGTVMIFSQELLARSLEAHATTDLERSGMLGLSLFAVAWLISGPVRRLGARDISVPTTFRAGLDVEQIARLNEEIVQELDSGVLVVDASGTVQVMNDSARVLLACEFVALPAPLRLLAPELVQDLSVYYQTPDNGSRPVTLKDTGQMLLPRYSSLSRGGMLIRLEDHSMILSQFQQLKLASLGRLSASIAHEIRNPLGAISHAIQLMQESEHLTAEDKDLGDVALRQSARIDRIINDVLHFSNRESATRDRVSMTETLIGFKKRFIEERALPDDCLRFKIEGDVFATVDADQLDQILWNLCSNALLHNAEDVRIILHARAVANAVTIDVKDNGRGIDPARASQLFEPFYSSSDHGSGLGLYIVRELCHANNGSIDIVPSDSGAHFRVTLQADSGDAL